MIGTRLAAALSLILAIIAVTLGVAALMASLRDDDPERGRLVQTRLEPSPGQAPVLFPLDEFYASTGGDGRLRALYVYPPGFAGHTRGCKVVWVQDGATAAGVFADPCDGSRFAADGSLLSGPADRGLDEFKAEPAIEGLIVDTRTLYCGQAPAAQTSIAASPNSAVTSAAVAPPAAAATSPGTLVVTATPAPSATPPATVTRAPTPAGAHRETCVRVSADGG